MKNLPGCSLWAVALAAGLVCTPALADVAANAGGAGAAGVVGVEPVSPQRLYLRPAEVDTSRARPDLHAQIGVHPPGTRFVVQLDGPITPERHEAMVAAGVEPGAYLPQFAYITTLDGADPAAVAGLDFIRWHSVYLDEWKLDPEIGLRPYQDADRQALVAAGRDYLVVTTFTGADVAGVEQAIWAVPGAAVIWSASGGGQDIGGTTTELYVEMNVADVGQLAALPGVQYVEPASDIDTRAMRRNDRARWIVQSNEVGVFPLYAQGLRGEGQIVGILDTRIGVDHCSFADPGNPIGPNHRKIVAWNEGSGSGQTHGSHVAGTAVGDAGQNTGNTRGIAYEGRLAYAHWGSSPFGDIYQRFETHHNQGARMHSNSWGDDGTTAYNALTRNIDLFQWDHEDSLTLWAVTNLSNLRNPENAKNTLAVGASRSAGEQHQHCTGGDGPTSDGRRKPEIYAPGCSTVSANTSGCGTRSSTGTSMACPAVAGVAMLARQYFMDGFYPVGIQIPGSEFTPSAALVKGVLLNSAVDMTGVPGYPSNREGWGRVLADNSLYFEGDDRKLRIQDVWNADGLTTGQFVEYPLPVLGSDEQLRVTLAWTEPPGTAGTSFAHVNDLDLEVIDPTGQLYRGNVFDTMAGHSITGGSKDDRNNVEQVHINNPAPGLWTVRVRAAAVNQAQQGYALVMTGDITPAEPPALILILGDPVPFMVEPNEAAEMRVRILEGSNTLVPGTGRLHFRDEPSGSFSEVPLTHVSGDIYAADLPPTSCGKSLEFYFSAVADDNTTVTLPDGAPDFLFSTNVAVMVSESLLETTFQSAWPAGWWATGLWHVSNACLPPGGTPCAPGPYAYYGRTTTCTYNLPTGANSGELFAPQIEVPVVPPPPAGNVTLRFCYALETEEHPSFDRAELFVNGNTRPEWRIDDVKASSDYWTTAEFDLTEFAGETVSLAWRFDTVTGTNNNFRGWHINNIEVIAAVAGCEETCYADCDENQVLNIGDFLCFIDAFATGDPYADCDGNGTLNIGDFLCFIDEFALGCP